MNQGQAKHLTGARAGEPFVRRKLDARGTTSDNTGHRHSVVFRMLSKYINEATSSLWCVNTGGNEVESCQTSNLAGRHCFP